ncbi:MAG TPA: hypothetical protein VIK40_00695 [Geomonas sp.]
MEPYPQIFPDSDDAVLTLKLDRKSGRIPKGDYSFVECYCTDPQCDCRRVTLAVINEKTKQKALISLGFDQEGPLAGPFLDPSHRQSAYADELLVLFVMILNDDRDWLSRMYRHYRAVRKKVDGKTYRGKAFPKPGQFVYQPVTDPDLETLDMERMLEKLAASVRAPRATSARKTGGPVQGSLSEEKVSPPRASTRPAGGMASFVERYLRLGSGRVFAGHAELADELRQYLLANDRAGDELAALLPALCQQSPEDDERIDAALRLLFDSLELLRVELERRRPGSQQRMELLQNALAQRIFLENEDGELCAAVSQTLLHSRVEILPVLREANSHRVMSDLSRTDLQELPGEELMAGLFRSIEEMGLASPFEGIEAMLQLLALGDPEMQTALTAEMLAAENPLIRDIAALMLFHPVAEVRLGVSRLLAGSEGRNITAETLRRLIVSRNWFPENIRKNLDQAISSARKARVECAALPRHPAMTVHASGIDGAGAQSFQVIVPDGKGFSSCAILLKQGVGVADAFVVALKNKRELKEFLALLKDEASFIESSADHLDQCVSYALAEGARHGNAPNYWLVRIAELLGRGQWNATPFDPRRELEQLRRSLAAGNPKLLAQPEVVAAHAAAAEWPLREGFARSWFEDDDALDRTVNAAYGRKKSPDSRQVILRILGDVLEKRREVWLERLVLTALWLNSSAKPPVPWHQMYHLADAVADETLPLREIPLMTAIAELSLAAYLARLEEGRVRVPLSR